MVLLQPDGMVVMVLVLVTSSSRNKVPVIGYDAIETGSGYGPKTKGKVYDDCGKGNGVVIRPVIDDNGGIIDIIVEQPGTGYLPSTVVPLVVMVKFVKTPTIPL